MMSDGLIVGKLIVLVGIGVRLCELVVVFIFEGILVELVWNFEFLCEGKVVEDILCFDWIVIGGVFLVVEVILCIFYVKLIVLGIFVIVCDLLIVELVKVSVNVFLVIKIFFINVIVEFC